MTGYTMTDYIATDDICAFIRLGFRRAVSTDFRVPLPADRDGVLAALEAAGDYNDFAPEGVFRLIDGWWSHLMRVELAREGSPALYLYLPHWQRQALDADRTAHTWPPDPATRIDDDTSYDTARRIAAELRQEHADETSYDPATRTLRARWD